MVLGGFRSFHVLVTTGNCICKLNCLLHLPWIYVGLPQPKIQTVRPKGKTVLKKLKILVVGLLPRPASPELRLSKYLNSGGGLPRDQDKCPALKTAISRKVLGKNVHATILKGRWLYGYDQYTVPNDCSCRIEPVTVLLLFFIALANIRPGLDLSCHSFKYSEERWTQNHPQYLSGLSSALPFPTASRNNCRLV